MSLAALHSSGSALSVTRLLASVRIFSPFSSPLRSNTKEPSSLHASNRDSDLASSRLLLERKDSARCWISANQMLAFVFNLGQLLANKNQYLR